MSQLQLPARLTLKVISKVDWDGNLLISPVSAPETASPQQPGKKVGDLVVVSSDPAKLLVSLGPADKLNSAHSRKAGEATGLWLTQRQAKNVALSAKAFDTFGFDDGLEAFCEGLLLGTFQFNRYRGREEKTSAVEVLVLTDEDDPSIVEKIAQVSAIVHGVNLAREWSHEPPNIINPATLAERAQSLADESGLKCTVFGEAELTEMGAGAILSVGLGSKTPSQMIILEHAGHGEDANKPPVVVVGKAITFDTGGYSLKNPQGMLGMKFDKCGGMDVLGIMQAVAALNLPIPVIGIVAAAENMISSYAYRPNDIITSLSGQTIEIVSTDAEGRMVLSDALTYASTELKPRAIIDLATLTGGVITALGKVRAGLMSTDGDLATALKAAGERSGERLWRFPLDEEYFELIRGSDSDLRNSAGKPLASSIVGGTFLKQFVMNDIPWAHIDIAGTATIEKGPSGGKEATGFSVRLVLNYLQSLS
jgi:leucyl aminopeptidase